MIQRTTIEQARTLAVQRWDALFPFSLDPSTWDSVFSQYRPGEILQAIRLMNGTRDPRFERVYLRFQQMLQRTKTQRN